MMNMMLKGVCVLLGALVIAGAQSVHAEETVHVPRQPYELCFADSMNEVHAPNGIESGWEIDNRAGRPRTELDSSGVLSDVMTDEHSRLIRYFNVVSEGSIDLQFQVNYVYNFNGNVLSLNDAEGNSIYRLVTSEGRFAIQQIDGSLTYVTQETCMAPYKVIFRVTADLDTGTAHTWINNVDCGTSALLGSSIRSLSFETSDETLNETQVIGGYVQANYAVYEAFDDPVSVINCEFENANQLVLRNQAMELPAGVQTARDFAPRGGKVVFQTYVYLPENSAGHIRLSDGGQELFAVEMRDGAFRTADAELKAYSDKLWYHLRLEADLDAHTVTVKVNHQTKGTFALPENITVLNRFELVNTGNTEIGFDDLQVFDLVDYDVPAPVVPEKENDYILGMNVCSLWRNGEHFGWSAITPYDDLKSVLGYYDEGQPETADWEIRFMAEHGINFEAFCWLGRDTDQPMKIAWDSTQLNDAYLEAKYSNFVKFCLIWEAQNGSTPNTSTDFRNYFVPYWLEYYFSNPNYMTIDGKPVFMIFGAQTLVNKFGNTLKDEFDYLRGEVRKLGFEDMLILDCNSYMNTSLKQYGFDGWYAYNWGKQGCYFSANESMTMYAVNQNDVYTVPTISTGFNAIGWSGIRTPVMSLEEFRQTNEWVKNVYLPTYAQKGTWQEKLIMLSNWNEYGEGTYLMPCEGTHGFGYLDILREMYTTGGAHEDIVPNEEQLARITHNYPQDRRVLRQDGTYQRPMSSNVRTVDMTADNWHDWMDTNHILEDETVDENGRTLYVGDHDDPQLNFSKKFYEGLAAKDVLAIRVVASIPKGKFMQLFFGVNGTGLSEGNSIRIYAESDEEHEYVFELSSVENWNGQITALRLDPLSGANTHFTIRSITLELQDEVPEIIVNGLRLENTMQIQTVDGVDYMPFDPTVSLIQEYLYTYYEWNHDAQVLTLTRDGHSYRFAAGSSVAVKDGTEEIPLDGAVFMNSGIPMLPIESFARVLGFPCIRQEKDYCIDTPEKTLFSRAAQSASGKNVWVFDTLGYFGQTSAFQLRGWKAERGTVGYGVDYVQLMTDATGTPCFTLTKAGQDCAVLHTLEIVCRGEGDLTISFQTDEAEDAAALTLNLSEYPADGDGFRTISVDFADFASWTGSLKTLSIETTSDVLDIQAIRFVEAR